MGMFTAISSLKMHLPPQETLRLPILDSPLRLISTENNFSGIALEHLFTWLLSSSKESLTPLRVIFGVSELLSMKCSTEDSLGPAGI
jgi:hypothetical protein